MELESLRLIITEADLKELALRFLPPHDKVRNLSIRVTPRGLSISGTYDAALPIPFETVWQCLVRQGCLAARLTTLKAGFLRLGFGRSYVVAAIADAAGMIGRHGDTLLLDVDALLAQKGLPLRTNVSAIHCELGRLVIEARGVV